MRRKGRKRKRLSVKRIHRCHSERNRESVPGLDRTGEREPDAGPDRLGRVEALAGVLAAQHGEVRQDASGRQDVGHPERDDPHLMRPTGARGERCMAEVAVALAVSFNVRDLERRLECLSRAGLQGLQVHLGCLVCHLVHIAAWAA